MALTDNLIAYYKLDGNSNDSVGSNNGTDTNITYSTDYGKINQGARFQSNSSKIELVTASTLGLGGTSLSFSCWCRVETPSSSAGYILGFQSSSSYTFFEWAGFRVQTDGKLRFTFYTTSGSFKEYTSPNNPNIMNDGKKHHIVFNYDGASVKVYIDNSLFWTQNITGTISFNSTEPLRIGVGHPAAFYNGGIDEVGIWNKALSSTEITELYNSGNGLQYPFGNPGAFFQLF